MRIDYINNMKDIYRKEKIRTRRNTVLFFLGLAGVAYLSIVLSVSLFKRNDSVISGQSAVAKYESAVTKQATELPLTTTTATASDVAVKQSATPAYRPSVHIAHSVAPVTTTSYAPEHTWRSTSNAAITVHTTSSATVKNIGGGGSGGSHSSGGTTIASSSSAFGSSTSIMVVPTIARASSRNLNASTTMAAEAEVIESTAQERAAKPGIHKVNGYPDIPFPDPVGDGLWVLLFLAAGYGLTVIYRCKQRVN